MIIWDKLPWRWRSWWTLHAREDDLDSDDLVGHHHKLIADGSPTWDVSMISGQLFFFFQKLLETSPTCAVYTVF